MNTPFQLYARSQTTDENGFATRFAGAQDQIRKDPYRIGLPPVELGKRFIQMRMPFETEFWVAENSSGAPLGRIAANLSARFPNTGFIGFFEGQSFSVANALVQEALSWLKKRGVDEVYGPVNFNTWLPYRFRIHPDSSPVFAWEPINPPEYPIWFGEMGFSADHLYHSDGLDGLNGILEGTSKDYEKALKAGYTFRPADTEALLEKEVPILYKLSMPSFRENFLFEPVPYEFFKQLYVPLAKKADVSLARFACDPQGNEVAFFFNFKEGNSMVSKTVGVLPQARGLGLSNAMLHSAAQAAIEQGLSGSVMALMKSGIQSESYGKKQNRIWRHEYVLFKKELR
ncbi:MAG: GNAT family N-acetyltransferase [Bdellovibrio sp.]|nr:GNAT family N-acetyltransferase [Bdellovibrio sp.]